MFNLFKKIRSLSYSVIFSTCIMALPAGAGTEVLMEVDQGMGTKGPSTLAIQDGKVRINAGATSSDSNNVMIYDSQSDAMIVVDHSDKTFMVFDAQAMNQIQAQMAMVKKQMEQQLASMPAEQREMMKNMMQNRMPGVFVEQAPVSKIMQKTGKTETIAGYQCEVTDLLSAGVKTRELCVTDWDDISNHQEISTAMLGMMRFFDRMMETLTQNLPINKEMPFAELEKLGGFPVKMSAFEGGKLKETSQLISIKDKKYAADFFSVPKGYKKREMMPEGMMQ
jgi:hypothetical protein